MKRVTVSPNKGRWRVSVDYGDVGFTQDHRFKFLAVCAARAEAMKGTRDNPTSLLIKNKAGMFQEERTYPRSADPARSRG